MKRAATQVAADAHSDEGPPIRGGAEYIESLRGRKLKVYLFGELVEEPVDHPVIRLSINAVAETYDLAFTNSAPQGDISGIVRRHTGTVKTNNAQFMGRRAVRGGKIFLAVRKYA